MTEPFNNGYQFAWDSTSLGWLKTCPRLYYYSMVLGYRRKADGLSVHLKFGLVYHAALELYDHERAAGEGHEHALRSALRYTLTETWVDGAPWESEHNLKTRSSLIRSVIWYLEEFHDDNAKTVILDNGKPAVELSFKMQVGDNLLCGHLDRLVEYQDSTFVMDRKTTTTTVSSYFFDRFKPDNQMTLYTLASKIVFGAPVQGVIIDAAQIAVGFSRFARGITYRTPRELEEWLGDTNAWITQAHAFTDAKHFPQNDKACHQYGGCTFRRVCGSDPAVRDHHLRSDFEVIRWNPLIPR
jgi:hypothetical protein